MSAETLRRVAAAIRESVEVMADETGSSPDLFMLAVADWLDDEAGEIPPGATETKWGPINNAPAVKVAHAYLGGSA